ncbi:hypothetical protein RDV64_23410 (plasmid) [Acuticoccus sp. MNP-M23]|uniref:hypothetical protein n=1 Tax=Acuticoccus sp. MNP-M23 TaxID=3072793 RepID=UPI00281623F8|nr:hypothetical protein [Acuticoccus sp. MNP-M23]WMS45291.1 hypothetical protein RDV64_23410 [Acuticoccus sp. MNP-M23]
MTNGILSKVIGDIGEADSEARAESYTMVNVRPGEKVAAMLSTLSKLAGKSPSAVVTDEISRRLSDYARSSLAHSEAILDATEKALKDGGYSSFQSGSALDILQREGVVELETPFAKELRKSLNLRAKA